MTTQVTRRSSHLGDLLIAAVVVAMLVGGVSWTLLRPTKPPCTREQLARIHAEERSGAYVHFGTCKVPRP